MQGSNNKMSHVTQKNNMSHVTQERPQTVPFDTLLGIQIYGYLFNFYSNRLRCLNI